MESNFKLPDANPSAGQPNTSPVKKDNKSAATNVPNPIKTNNNNNNNEEPKALSGRVTPRSSSSSSSEEGVKAKSKKEKKPKEIPTQQRELKIPAKMERNSLHDKTTADKHKHDLLRGIERMRSIVNDQHVVFEPPTHEASSTQGLDKMTPAENDAMDNDLYGDDEVEREVEVEQEIELEEFHDPSDKRTPAENDEMDRLNNMFKPIPGFTGTPWKNSEATYHKSISEKAPDQVKKELDKGYSKENTSSSSSTQESVKEKKSKSTPSEPHGKDWEKK